ncbi:F-box/WD repeat-containing protein 7-like [Saccostrea cucullata]|uniref:F-box/WD repeat-containing protein 7-like n=1 Tax=Saccostrea cuccullata TaxID=36930 RepID=UPI002ED1F826
MSIKADRDDVKNSLSSLPPELVEKIFLYLDVVDLARLSCVCVAWREIANVDHIWLHHCMKRKWMKFGLHDNILHESPMRKPQSNISGTSPYFQLFVPKETRLSPICRWKNVFIRVLHLFKNWEKGRYTMPVTLRGHRDQVKAIDCNRTCIVSGSEDHSVMVWSLENCTKLLEIKVHLDAVTAVILKGNMLVTGCADSSVRVLDSTNGEVAFTLQGHQGTVDHLAIIEDFIVSAGTDRKVMVWSITERKLVHILRGHVDEIECMAHCGHTVVTGSWDKAVLVWDVRKQDAVQMLHGHREVVTCCYCNGDTVVSVVTCSYCNGDTVYCLACTTDTIASGSSDSNIIVWNYDGNHLHTLTGHLGIVRCLYINEFRLVSGGDQKKINVWDYRSGKLLNTVHRNPTRLHKMLVTDTKLITASPETPGTLTVISYW